MLLLAAFSLADNFALVESSPMLVLFGSVVPSLVWAGFFLALRRNARAAAGIALAFAVIPEAVVVCIRFQQAVNYWTPFGNALSLPGWLLRIGWAVFLLSLAFAPGHLSDRRTRRIALALAILSIPSALSTTFDAWNGWIGFLLDDIPKAAFWRVWITPAIRTIYWLAQLLFLWTTWGEPERRSSIEASSLRLTP